MAAYSWDGPRCLIETAEENTFNINQETMNLLKEVKVPVHVVAIAGLYRTGKSYLLNKLAGKNTGVVQALWGKTIFKPLPKGSFEDRRNPALFQAFDLGSTIQAKTKGIWAWCRPPPRNKSECLLLLDTEGLGDPEKGDKDHDAWIFVMSVLLSNTLVYNSKGTIDQHALDKLHFITDMSEHVKVRTGSEDDSQEFNGYFPDFIWAVRDFHLELEINGKPCTADEYMENSLWTKTGPSRKIYEYNLPRQNLKQFFPSRKCFVFPQPLDDMMKITRLESLPEYDLKEDFLDITDNFLKYVINRSRPKCIRGAPVTGSGLANLCEIYVKAIQDGAVPCIENAVDTMARSENTKATADALKLYRTEIRSLALPVETMDHLSGHHQQCEKKAIAVFINSSIFDTEQKYQTQLAESIQVEYEQIQAENEKASCTKCQEILEELYSPISHNVASGHYSKPGGYEIYRIDMDNLQMMYKQMPGKGIKAAEKLREFMDEKAAEHDYLLAADIKLSAEEKRLKEEQRNAAMAEIQKNAVKAERDRTLQTAKDKENSIRQHETQVNEKNKKEMENLAKLYEEQMNTKLKEYEEMLRNGFKEQGQPLLDEIESLKAAKKDRTVVVPLICVVM